MATFESMDRRMPKIEACLKANGLESLDACNEMLLAKGIDCDKIVRYQMVDILFSMSVFFIVFAACFGLGWAIIAFAGEGGTPFKGMYLWMCVFLGLCGGISYSIDFKFALQCGVTRAQAYLSTALSFGVVALVFALVDQLLLAVLPLWGRAVDSRAVRDRKSTRLNSSHIQKSRMPSSA